MMSDSSSTFYDPTEPRLRTQAQRMMPSEPVAIPRHTPRLAVRWHRVLPLPPSERALVPVAIAPATSRSYLVNPAVSSGSYNLNERHHPRLLLTFFASTCSKANEASSRLRKDRSSSCYSES